MKILQLTCLLFFLGISVAYALPPIQTLDTNQDGKVTWEEYSARFKNQTKDLFNEIDQNKDGSLDDKEFTAFRARMKGNPHTQQKQDTEALPVLQK